MSDGCWALVAGTLGEKLRRSTRFPKIQRYVSGSVFVGLGAVAALSAPAKSS
jgi:threonine/homoserine/homoserine lactone efflux protein